MLCYPPIHPHVGIPVNFGGCFLGFSSSKFLGFPQVHQLQIGTVGKTQGFPRGWEGGLCQEGPAILQNPEKKGSILRKFLSTLLRFFFGGL